MDNSQLVTRLKSVNIIKENGKINSHILRICTKNEELMPLIVQATNFLDINCTLRERMMCICNNITERARCLCGNVVTYNGAVNDYQPKCARCACYGPETVAKRKATNLVRYGSENSAHNPDIAAKRAATNLAKYGVEYPLQNKDIHYKTTEHVNGGGFKSSLTRMKAESVNIDRHGTRCPANTPENQLTKKQKMQQLYGVDNNSQKHIADILPLLQDKDWLYEQHITNSIPLCEIARRIGVDQATVQNYVHKFGIEIKRYAMSYPHTEISNYLTSLGIIHTNNDRSIIPPKEIDIYIESLGIAIEFNGVHWHSEGQGKDKHYHISKTRLCAQQGIQLIHIFEDEWVFNREIVLSRLSAKLGKIETKIFARKCKVVELTAKQAIQFCKDNHIQGSVGARYRYGLEYEGSVVACMTFGVSRYSKDHQYELLRFCTKLNSTVVGGASKLFTHFIKNVQPNSVITYSDTRWNTGLGYLALGMTFLRTSDSNYFYIRPGQYERYSRATFQKHKLSKLLDNFDPNMSEVHNMFTNGWDRIWDCGNDVYEWKAVLN